MLRGGLRELALALEAGLHAAPPWPGSSVSHAERSASCPGKGSSLLWTASQAPARTSARMWGRAHRSNYVYFVVNLRNAQYAQKCHDPNCAHFRSEWMPLPRALVLQSQAS